MMQGLFNPTVPVRVEPKLAYTRRSAGNKARLVHTKGVRSDCGLHREKRTTLMAPPSACFALELESDLRGLADITQSRTV